MGTDIHAICQVKDNEVWRNNTDKIFPNGENEGLSPCEPRHYDWFSVLANVRNGYGFAGVLTGQEFKFIDEPRGLPEDFNDDSIYLGYHSYSFVTLDDFDKFDWNQVTMKTGVIRLDEYEKLRGKNTEPDSYCGHISGPGISIINESSADIIIDNGKEFDGDKIYVQYYWSIIYREHFSIYFEEWIDPMRKLKEKYQDVRIIFGFDS